MLRALFPHLFVSFLAAAALSACGSAPDDEPRQYNAALGSGDLRWASFPIPLQAEEDSLYNRGDAEQDLQDAIHFWEERAGKTLFQLSGWPTGQIPYTGRADDPTGFSANVIFFPHPWPSSAWGSGVAGKTFLFSQGNTIQHVGIYLNPDTPLCTADCTGAEDHTSRRKLIAHELGHVLGFAHVEDKGNIMYAAIQPGGDLESERVDLDLLKKLTN